MKIIPVDKNGCLNGGIVLYNLGMVDENSVSVEQAAMMLNTDIESVLAEALDLGIDLEHDPDSGLDYLSADDFDRIKETWITKD